VTLTGSRDANLHDEAVELSLAIYKNTTTLISDAQPLFTPLDLQSVTGYCSLTQVRPVYSFYGFRTDPLKTTLVTSQLRHPLHSNGLLRRDRPTENTASNALQYRCVSALPRTWDQQAVSWKRTSVDCRSCGRFPQSYASTPPYAFMARCLIVKAQELPGLSIPTSVILKHRLGRTNPLLAFYCVLSTYHSTENTASYNSVVYAVFPLETCSSSRCVVTAVYSGSTITDLRP
jgi:hypothetical protein